MKKHVILVCLYGLFGIILSKETHLIMKNAMPSNSYNITLNEGETVQFMMNISHNISLLQGDEVNFTTVSEDSSIAKVLELNYSNVVVQNSSNETLIISVKGGRLGITKVAIKSSLPDMPANQSLDYVILLVKVLRQKTLLDGLTVFLLGPLVLINKCAFGAKIEIEVLKRVMTKPIELVLCLAVQFVIMPFLGVCFGHLFNLNQVMALALFVSASCPGGGGGYVFSFLINGDITLAITASLVSTLVAMGAMPALIGLYTVYADVPSEIRIPYIDIFLMLLVIAVPISSGMFIRRKWPKFAEKLIVVIKPLSLFIIAGGLLIIIFTSRYVLYGPKIGFLLAFLLPSSTFAIAMLLSLCFCFSWPLSKAVSLESGLKNTVLGIAVIELSFPQPEADLASVLIIMISIGHTLTALAWYFLYLIKVKLCGGKSEEKEYYKIAVEDDSSDETTVFIAPKEN